MNFITKNLKQAGIFNTILITITIVLQIYLMCNISNRPALQLFNSVIILIALVSGLFYAFYGYKKEAAKYYKLFMILTLITFVSSVASHLPYFAKATFNTCAAFARIIPIALLTFKKDFGKKNSIICACVVFACSLLILIGSIVITRISTPYNIVLSLNQVLLSAIVIIFVEAKYADKDARGTK